MYYCRTKRNARYIKQTTVKSKGEKNMCKCNSCGHVFEWTKGFEDVFGDTICPICGSDDCEEKEDETT